MTLGRQIDHQVSAYVGDMPATLLGTLLSICLTLDQMGLTKIAAEMAQDIANEVTDTVDMYITFNSNYIIYANN
jgi:hypothetical protein